MMKTSTKWHLFLFYPFHYKLTFVLILSWSDHTPRDDCSSIPAVMVSILVPNQYPSILAGIEPRISSKSYNEMPLRMMATLSEHHTFRILHFQHRSIPTYSFTSSTSSRMRRFMIEILANLNSNKLKTWRNVWNKLLSSHGMSFLPLDTRAYFGDIFFSIDFTIFSPRTFI